MPVCKFIFRIDFPVNFDVIDMPGEIMKIMLNAKKDFWGEAGLNSASRSVTATYKRDDGRLFRQIVIEPRALILDFESTSGLSLAQLDEDQDVSTLFDLANELVDYCEIEQVTRMGYRIFYFNQLGENVEAVLAAFRGFTGPYFTQAVEPLLGPIKDYGYSIEGVANDKVGYRLLTGPFRPVEGPKYLQAIDATKLSEHMPYNFICDLDLFDANFSLAKVPLVKWARNLHPKQTKLLGKIEEVINAGMAQH